VSEDFGESFVTGEFLNLPVSMFFPDLLRDLRDHRDLRGAAPGFRSAKPPYTPPG
jgi:hypothetical protein